MKHTKYVIISLLTAVVFFVSSCNSYDDSTLPNVVSFKSHNGRTIKAEFTNHKVKVKLWNGKTFTVPQVLSGSGARFSDGNHTLWNKGNKVTIWQNNKPVFIGYCN
jgi:membrane-bound inhibitor of C-type lysozyme